MAWTSKGEEVKGTLVAYVNQLEPKGQKNLRKLYDKAMSPSCGEWMTMNEVTFVNLRNWENVLDNLSLAIFKEAVGLGPQCYCILQSHNADFESFLLLALHYLPREKFCIYPEDDVLVGPFVHTPWIDLGRDLCSRPTISIETFLTYLAVRAREAAPL